jgi:hypothetical protein
MHVWNYHNSLANSTQMPLGDPRSSPNGMVDIHNCQVLTKNQHSDWCIARERVCVYLDSVFSCISHINSLSHLREMTILRKSLVWSCFIFDAKVFLNHTKFSRFLKDDSTYMFLLTLVEAL